MDFPFELWLNIAQFLPPDELQRLYTVNRALFNIAMDERCKLLRFRRRKKIIENVRLLRTYKYHAQRVRRLEIWPQIIPKLAYKPLSKRKRFQDTIMRLITGRHSVTTQATAAMVEVISEMTNLTEYVHRCRDCLDLPDLVTFLPVVKTGWTVFGHNLRVLILNVVLEGCEYILSPSLTFSRLETLIINISKAYRTTDCSKIISNLLVPFVNNHHTTLRSFEVSSYDYFDLCVLFGGLQQSANLTQLKIDYRFASLELTNTSGLHHLLQLHTTSLQEFNLQFHPIPDVFVEYPLPSKWFQQRFLQVKLPELQSLDLGMEYFATDLHRTADYLKQYQNSLTSLALRSAVFTLFEVDILISAFAGTNHLRKLDIGVFHFSATLLDLLAMKLPCLHHLELGFDRFSSELELDYFPIYIESFRQLSLFCQALRTHNNYSDWKLRHLYAHSLGHTLGDLTDCQKAIAGALPNLETLRLEWSGPDLRLSR